jgi:hypothetical protein
VVQKRMRKQCRRATLASHLQCLIRSDDKHLPFPALPSSFQSCLVCTCRSAKSECLISLYCSHTLRFSLPPTATVLVLCCVLQEEEEEEEEEEQVLRSLPARVTTSIHGGDHQCHGVPGHREAEASQDGLRLLRVRRRGRVDAAGEQGGLLQDLVSSLSLSLYLSLYIYISHPPSLALLSCLLILQLVSGFQFL